MRRFAASWVGLAAGASLAFLALGCGGGGGGGGGGEDPPPVGLDARVPVTTLTFPGVGPVAGSVRGADAFPTLRFASPVHVTHAPGDRTRLFVVEQRGRIRVVSGAGTAATVATFLDITDRVTSAMGEEGLFAMAFDPAFATNRRFYVQYVAAGSPRRSVVARYLASDADPDVALRDETVLLTQDQPYSNHNGGALAFGPDGFLYVGLGDGGSAGDPQNRALDKTTLLGKILRIDPRGTGPGTAYAIPPDNPFVGGTAGERAEIYAYGLRNPWRISFDRTTGALWAGDVGQVSREEIDLVRRGGNYGWRAKEGTLDHSASDLGRGPFEAPVIDYDRSQGTCVVGGHVYRGASLPSLYGAYLYADYYSGRLWALLWDGARVVQNVQVGTLPTPSSFGEDADGEVYVCDHGGGRVLRLEAVGSPTAPFPATLSATGLFEDVATLRPAPGVLPYDVASPLWSDGAAKERLVALPGDARVAWSRDGPWAWPVGSVLVKTFHLPLVRGLPSSSVRVETRVFVLGTNGWEGYSYRWRDDGSEADLLPAGDARTLTVADASAPGGQVEVTWTFPSRADCLRCHTEAAGRVLGLTTRQLNRDLDYAAVGGRRANQLRTWDHLGLFDVGLADPDGLPAFPAPQDETAPLADRARAYLDANCATCHRAGGPAGTDLDLRATIPTSSMHAVDVVPTRGGLGLPDPRIVAPGNAAGSVLWLRHSALDANRMPPLGTGVVDEEGSDLLRRWIDAGP